MSYVAFVRIGVTGAAELTVRTMMRFSKRLVMIVLALCLTTLAGLFVPASMLGITFDAQAIPTTAAPTNPLQIAPPDATSFPASPGAHFDKLTTEDGLSQNTVTSILQDTRGFMWFGTEDGLNKYDGHTFTVYRHDPDDPDIATKTSPSTRSCLCKNMGRTQTGPLMTLIRRSTTSCFL